MSIATCQLLSSYASEAIRVLHQLDNSNSPQLGQLNVCVKTLLEICQLAVLNKKVIQNECERRRMCKYIASIKHMTPKFSKCCESFPDKKSKCSKYIARLIHCVESILGYFEIPSEFDSTKMLQESDTLYFDFTLTAQPGDTHLETKNKSQHETQESTSSPMKSSEVLSLDLMDETAELVTTANAAMKHAKKLTPICSSKEESRLKSLRQVLSQAITKYDVSTSNLLSDLQNNALHEQLKDNAKVLLEAINKMKDFILPISTRTKPCHRGFQGRLEDNQFHPFHSATYSSHASRLAPLNKNKIQKGVKCLEKKDVGRNPVTKRRILAKVNYLVESCLSADAATFEEVTNAVTDYQDAIKTISSDTKKIAQLEDKNFGDHMEESSRKTRQLLRHSRELFLQQNKQNDDLVTLKALVIDWCTLQTRIVNELWNTLKPWSDFTGSLFEKRDLDSNSKPILETLMSDFKEIETQVQKLVSDYFEQDTGCVSNEEKKSHQVKTKNLSLELKEHSEQVLKVTKLHILGDINPEDWLSFGLVLLKWSNCVHQLLFHLSVLFNSHDQEPSTNIQQNLTEKHSIMQNVIKKSLHGCQDKEIEGRLLSFSEELQNIHDATIKEHSAMTPSVGQVFQVVLQSRWKLKAFQVQQLIEKQTKDIATPVTTLISSSLNNVEDDYTPVFLRKMERMRTHTCLAVDKSTMRRDVHNVIETIDEIEEVSENLLTNCRLVREQPKSLSLHSAIQFLRFQWLSLTNYLLYTLRQLPQVRYAAISAIMRHLMAESDVSNPREFLDVLYDEATPLCLPVSPSLYSTNGTSTLEQVDSLYGTMVDYSENSEDIGDIMVLEENISNVSFGGHPEPSQMIGIETSVVKTREVKAAVSPAISPKPAVPQKSAVLQKPAVSPKPPRWKLNLLNEKSLANSNSSEYEKCDGGTRIEEHSARKSIAAAAQKLHREADIWEDENNSIVKAVKLMASQMYEMAEYLEGRGTLKSKDDLVLTAKAIAANAKIVAKFASIVAEHCDDQSCFNDLQHYIELVPTISTQLRIVANVKSVNTYDETANLMLVTNAENLMKGIVGTLKAAEAACMKISNDTFINSMQGDANCELAFQWKRKVRMKRAMNALVSPRDDLGLRSTNKNAEPSLADLILD